MERATIFVVRKADILLTLPLFIVLWLAVMPFFAPELPAWQYPLTAAVTTILMAFSILLRVGLVALSDRMSGLAPIAVSLHVWGDVPRSPMAPGRAARALIVAMLASLLATSLFLGIVARLSGPDTPLAITTVALVLALYNLLLAVISLLPAFPLPAGRLLVAVVARRATPEFSQRLARGLCIAGGVALFGFAVWRGWGGAPLSALVMSVIAVHFIFAGLSHARKERP